MKAGQIKADRKTETLQIRLHAKTKKVLKKMSVETGADSITSLIESFASAYENGKIKSGDLELKNESVK